MRLILGSDYASWASVLSTECGEVKKIPHDIFDRDITNFNVRVSTVIQSEAAQIEPITNC